jgi:glycopeptide antibiotics resistance protein
MLGASGRRYSARWEDALARLLPAATVGRTMLSLPGDAEVPPVKLFSKILFAAYLFLLAWLILFKVSFDIPTAFAQQTRNINLIPFADDSRSSLREMAYNVVAFLPFGLLLGVNLKRATFWRKLALICGCSFAVETIQYLFGIGVSDITDLITNTAGGLIGLALYALGKNTLDEELLDRVILIAGAILLVVCIVLLALIYSLNIRFRVARP